MHSKSSKRCIDMHIQLNYIRISMKLYVKSATVPLARKWRVVFHARSSLLESTPLEPHIPPDFLWNSSGILRYTSELCSDGVPPREIDYRR